MKRESREDLEQRLLQLQARYDTLLMAFEKLAGAERQPSERAMPFAGDVGVWQVIGSMTGKQHATMQMLLAARPNMEIARRLGVTEATAKTHVRSLCVKLGVKTRSEFVVKVKPVFDRIPDSDYMRMSGLPKDWNDNWRRPDPYAQVYGGD